MKSVFADSFYFIALLSTQDATHDRAVAFTANFTGQLITTAWVLTELADGMCAPTKRALFVDFLTDLRANPQFTIMPPDAALFEKGLELYAHRLDKG